MTVDNTFYSSFFLIFIACFHIYLYIYKWSLYQVARDSYIRKYVLHNVYLKQVMFITYIKDFELLGLYTQYYSVMKHCKLVHLATYYSYNIHLVFYDSR